MKFNNHYESLVYQLREIWESAEKGSIHYKVLAERIETMIYYFYIKQVIDSVEMKKLLNANRAYFKDIKARSIKEI